MQNSGNVDCEYLSVKEFACLMSVHYNTVIRSIKSGRISAVRLGCGKRSCYRIHKSETNRIALFDMKEMIEKIIEEKER